MRLAVTEYEKELIERKMQQLGTKNFGAYARKMLIDGYIIKVDTIRSRRNSPPPSAVLPQISIRFAAASTPPDTSIRMMLQS